MRLRLAENVEDSAASISELIKRRLEAANPTAEEPFVLGCPVGKVAGLIYDRLVAFHERGELSFEFVIAFVIDEYVALPKHHASSQFTFMDERFFSRVNILPANIDVLDGNAADLPEECARFERHITAVGGIDLMFMGAGEDGAVGRNEPGSSLQSRTRPKSLSYETNLRLEESGRFARSERDDHFAGVPKQCLTMGIGTIAEVRQVIVMFAGQRFAPALHRALEGGFNHMCPVSVFQNHPSATFVCDEDSTLDLKVKTVQYFKGLLSQNQLVELREQGLAVPAGAILEGGEEAGGGGGGSSGSGSGSGSGGGAGVADSAGSTDSVGGACSAAEAGAGRAGGDEQPAKRLRTESHRAKGTPQPQIAGTARPRRGSIDRGGAGNSPRPLRVPSLEATRVVEPLAADDEPTSPTYNHRDL